MMNFTKKVNPDLEKEREKSSIDKSEFTNWWHGGAQKVELKRKIGKFHTTIITQFDYILSSIPAL